MAARTLGRLEQRNDPGDGLGLFGLGNVGLAGRFADEVDGLLSPGQPLGRKRSLPRRTSSTAAPCDRTHSRTALAVDERAIAALDGTETVSLDTEPSRRPQHTKAELDRTRSTADVRRGRGRGDLS